MCFLWESGGKGWVWEDGVMVEDLPVGLVFSFGSRVAMVMVVTARRNVRVFLMRRCMMETKTARSAERRWVRKLGREEDVVVATGGAHPK